MHQIGDRFRYLDHREANYPYCPKDTIWTITKLSFTLIVTASPDRSFHPWNNRLANEVYPDSQIYFRFYESSPNFIYLRPTRLQLILETINED